jgi:leucyl-tRNA synthetase
MDWTEQCDEIIDGCAKFLDRVWRLTTEDGADDTWREGAASEADVELSRATHRLIAKVSDELDRWSFNTAVAACMAFANELQSYRRDAPGGPHLSTYDAASDALLLMLAPMSPHMAAEAWERRHESGARVHAESWPSFDPDLVRAQTVTMVVQVNGKLRDRIEVSPDIDEEEATTAALGSQRVKDDLNGAEPRRVIARPPRLVNVVR